MKVTERFASFLWNSGISAAENRTRIIQELLDKLKKCQNQYKLNTI